MLLDTEYIETICVENVGLYDELPIGYGIMIFGNIDNIPVGLKEIVGLDLVYLKNKRSPI